MKERLENYRNTTVNWGKSQADIMKLLNSRGIADIQFTSVSHETASRGGLEMEPNTYAIVLMFQKDERIGDGVSGKIPVRIILPNIRQDDPKALNQFYRVLFWYLKTKFEAIDTGLVEFAEEFMPHLQIQGKQGFVGRLWDQFKQNYYRALETGEQGNANLLPPVSERQDEN